MKKVSWLLICIFLIILLIGLTVNANMYIIKDKDGNVVLMTNKNYLSYEQIEKGYTIILMSQSSSTSPNSPSNSQTNNFSEVSSPEETTDLQPKPLVSKKKADIKVVDWINRLSPSGDYVYVEGIIKNIGDSSAYYTKVIIKALDKQGKLVCIEKTYADPSTILPKQEVTFKVMIKNYKNINSFKLDTLWEEKLTDAKSDPTLNKKKITLEIIDWNSRPSASGKYIYVEGYLRNISKQIVKEVKVKVKSLDSNGKLLSIDDGYTEPSSIAPGKEATFQIMVENNYKIKKFSLTILTESTVSLEITGIKEKPLAKQIININTASLEELMYVLAISEHTAIRVINRRSDINGFKNPKDITLLIEIGKIEWEEWIKRGIVIII
jgi:DNA uptake protein ComE-like DNA-binding protein